MKISANPRQLQGSSASRRLRRAGRVPGIVYGASQEAVAIEVDHNTLFHSLRVEAFHSSVLDVDINGKPEQVVLRDVQWHPYKRQVLHVDFQRILANEKMTLSIPLHFDGQDESPAVKLHNAIVNHVLTEVEVSCLPRDLPEYITVDMSELDVDSVVHISNLKVPNGVEIVIVEDTDPVVATVPVKSAKDEAADEAADAPPAEAPTAGDEAKPEGDD